MNFLYRIAILSIALVLFFVTPALSVPTYFTDRSSFELAAGGGLNFESFETPTSAAFPSIDFGSFTVSEIGNADADLNKIVVGALLPFDDATDGDYRLYYYNNGPSIARFDSFASTTYAFGLDVINTIDCTVTISGSASYSFSLLGSIPQFWGVIDTSGITSLDFFFSGGMLDTGGGFPGFDAVSYSAPVPEPATITLLASGLLGLASMRRKFKK